MASKWGAELRIAPDAVRAVQGSVVDEPRALNRLLSPLGMTFGMT
jgi:hypothetical protein